MFQVRVHGLSSLGGTLMNGTDQKAVIGSHDLRSKLIQRRRTGLTFHFRTFVE